MVLIYTESQKLSAKPPKPFHAIGLFLYPMKISKKSLDLYFQGVQKETSSIILGLNPLATLLSFRNFVWCFSKFWKGNFSEGVWVADSTDACFKPGQRKLDCVFITLLFAFSIFRGKFCHLKTLHDFLDASYIWASVKRSWNSAISSLG